MTLSSVQVDKPGPSGGFSSPLTSMCVSAEHLNLRTFSVCQPSHHHHSKLDETKVQSRPWRPKLTAQKARLVSGEYLRPLAIPQHGRGLFQGKRHFASQSAESDGFLKPPGVKPSLPLPETLVVSIPLGPCSPAAQPSPSCPLDLPLPRLMSFYTKLS